jgi:hypothetical protein
MSFAFRGPRGIRGADGPATVDVVSTPGVTPPTLRDADVVIPDTVLPGHQVTYYLQLRCRNNTTASWREETFSVVLSLTSGGTVQIDRQQIGSAVNSGATFGWTGTIVLVFGTYSDGVGYRVRVTCTGTNTAPLPAGCTWAGQAVKMFDQVGLT